MHLMSALTILLCLGLISGLKSTNSSGLAPPAGEKRASVQFVPSNLEEDSDNIDILECNNEPVQIFDGSVYRILRKAPIRSSCPYNFQVQPGVAVDIMCSYIHVPCRRDTAIIVSSSGSGASSFCTEKGIERNVRISLRAFDEVTDLRLEHDVNGKKGGRGFSCIVRGLGGTQEPNDDEERVEINHELQDNSTLIQSRLSLDCGRTRYTRIINGGLASFQEYPWMAGLILGGGFCGGSLINAQWILTAAHCSINTSPSSITAYLGCQDILCNDNVRSISRNVIPDSYSFPVDDIALLQLSSPLTSFSDAIRPVCLTCNLVADNTRLFISGWGRTQNGGLANQLKEAEVDTMSDDTCRWIPSPFPIVCTSTVTGNSCNGDSGSPLVLQRTRNNIRRFVQYALVSFGESTCNVNFESGNTELPYYLGFIRQIAGYVQIVN